MTNDHGFVYTEHRSTAVVFEIKPVKIFCVHILTVHDNVQGFCQFQDNISGKTFADQHICMVKENIPSFHITDKLNRLLAFSRG